MKKINHYINIHIKSVSQEFQIAQSTIWWGGDWYSDPSSLPNLLNYLKQIHLW